MENTKQVKSIKVCCQSPYPRKSRLVYILLALFLGTLGIHNFYAGRSGVAIFQCMITLLIGWLVVPLLIVLVWIIFEILAVNKDGGGIPFN